jgi:transcriptional regulator with XRE-family HTH domain
MKMTRLKQLRMERGVLQISLAQSIPMPQARLSLIENAHVEPTAAELQRIALALGVPIETLTPESRPAA